MNSKKKINLWRTKIRRKLVEKFYSREEEEEEENGLTSNDHYLWRRGNCNGI